MSVRIDFKAKTGLEFQQADHPYRVLSKTEVGLANCSQVVFLDVGKASNIVDDGLCCRVVEEAVNGKIAPQRILFGSPPDVISKDQRVRFGISRPKGRHFDCLLSKTDVGQAKAPSDQDAVAKEPFNLLGLSRGGDIEVFGFLVEKKVADAPADKIGCMARGGKFFHNEKCMTIDLA